MRCVCEFEMGFCLVPLIPPLPLGLGRYVYYLSKFYEMIDTWVLALKKKPLTFLQM